MADPVKAKRSSISHYLNTGTSLSPTWSRLGYAVSTGEIQYNPETEETSDITMDVKITEIVGYKRSFPVEGVVYPGDAAFDFIDNIRITLGVLADAKSELINVWGYKTPSGTPSTWPAEKVPVNIAVESIGGEGAATAKIKYTIYDAGDPVLGKFDPSNKTFTANT